MTRVLSSEGGIETPLGDQESVGCDAERHVVVKASPASTFIVIEAELADSSGRRNTIFVG